jgi:hypothetical protein
MPVNKPDKWAQYEVAAPAAKAKPDKWAQYEDKAVSAPQRSFAPPPAPQPSAASQEGFLSSLAAPFIGAAKGLKSAIYEGPQNPVEARIVNARPGVSLWQDASPIVGRAVLAAKRMLVDPQVEQGRQARSEFQQAGKETSWTSMHPSAKAVEHREKALGHGLAAAVPMAGPWAAQLGELEGEQIGTGNYAGAAGTALGNAALALAPKAAGKALHAAPEAAQSVIRRLAGSGPGVARNLARQVAEDNRKISLHNADRRADAQQTWQEKQAEALESHKAELLRLKQKYAQDTRVAQEKARTGTAADRAQYQEKQLAAKQKYDQSVRDAKEKFQQARAAAQKANTAAEREHAHKIGQVAQQNRAATAAERAKSDQAVQMQVGGSQLIYGLNQLDRSLRERANSLYDVVRERMSSASLPSDALTDAVKAAQEKWIRGSPEKVREFNAMLSTGEPGPELALANQTAQNLGYKDFHAAITSPQMRDTLSRVLPPDVWQAAIGQGTKPISWNDLQGFYEETGAKIADGPQPGKGDIYKALQQVHGFIGDQMQQLADAHDTGPQFQAARAFYRDYMKAFHDPTGPSSSGSPIAQALLAKDPLTAVDKFAGDAGDRGVANLRQYSDSLANLAQKVRQTAQTKVSIPARKTVADIPAPKVQPVPAGANLSLPPIMESAPEPRAVNAPLPPILPEPEAVPFHAPKITPTQVISEADLRRANEAAVERRGSSAAGSLIRLAMVWPAFHMLSDLMRGKEVEPNGLAAIPAAGATSMAIEELLAHPDVREFLTRPTRQQVAQIPSELRGELPNIVAAAKGRGVPVSPLLAAYAAAMQRSQSRPDQQEQYLPEAQGGIQ